MQNADFLLALLWFWHSKVFVSSSASPTHVPEPKSVLYHTCLG